MKLSPLLVISSASALECYTCQTSDPSTCTLEKCPNDGQEWACQNEVRSHSRHYFVAKGCKQRMACMNNSIQNDRAAWIPSQCNPLNPYNSVCRCCCDDRDGCNKEDIFCLEAPKCPELEKRKNLDMECTKMREIGSECSFECSGDAELVGATKISCNNMATWAPEQPKCVPNCPTIEFEGGSKECSNGRRSGSTCKFSCREGTRLVGSKSTTCAADGSWTREAPTCEPICDELEVANGDVRCSNRNFLESICQISCDGDFERNGPATQTCKQIREYTADWDGNGETSCEAVCKALTDIPYGSTSCSNENKRNSECSFSCNDRFRLLGSPIITCQKDGKSSNGLDWSGPLPVCEAICEAIPVPENGESSCTDGRNLGSTCAFSCPAGTRLIGDKASTCTGFGGLANWTTQAPLCEPVCDDLTLKNGEINCTNDNFLNSKCSLSCAKKYERNGPSSQTCVETGPAKADWDGALTTTCQPICQPLVDIANGATSCNDGSRINSKCEFSCNERYQLRGFPSVTCQLDRTMENGLGWSGPIPGCEPICPEVPKVENAVVACDSATDIGSICKYVCKRGFELVGRPTTTCLLDVTDSTANWEIGLPRCQRTCDKPIEIENGEVSCQESGISAGQVCQYSCNSGYELRGEQSTTCTVTDGGSSWTNAPPSCEPVCGTPPVIEGATRTCDNGDRATYSVDSKCQFECGAMSRMVGDDSIVCKKDFNGRAYWSDSRPTCIPTCAQRTIHTPPMAVECTSGRDIGSTCSFACNELTTMEGEASVDCIADEISGEPVWSDEFPKCKPLCRQLPKTEAKLISCDNGNNAGSICTAECADLGYQLAGNEAVTCSTSKVKVDMEKVLLSNESNRKSFNVEVEAFEEVAEWDGLLGVCERTLCPTLVMIENGQVACTGSKYEDTCDFKCNDGYSLDGPATVTCLSGSRWSSTVPRCLPIPEEELADCPILKTNPIVQAECTQGNKVGSFCAFSCPTGYKLIGSTSTECLDSASWSEEELPDCKVRIMISRWISNLALEYQPNWRSAVEISVIPRNRDGKDDVIDEVVCELMQCQNIEEFFAWIEENGYQLSEAEREDVEFCCDVPVEE
ncbi:Oidioi.mRNA.OKI2018_I69.PAR.g11061.t1.cds [Oikopleura dioica]|uniref:Oidioi.mRNA.OKI2018_I69.PAR.g11061.t1.cds n=1 Tax=Oikopleura dioica TaxID=34765 RepID=A0ABN7S0L9_OIKDI|nr:Oidioi.mRNA.OKI2018_I69.PAR.g11061.t1.cds [Oikopleura dioica]